jgi:hypothetical protein
MRCTNFSKAKKERKKKKRHNRPYDFQWTSIVFPSHSGAPKLAPNPQTYWKNLGGKKKPS